MDTAEFTTWAHEHAARFDDFAALLAVADRQTFAAWRGAFVGATIESARASSRLMASGELKRPYRAEDHIPALAAKARSLAAAMTPVRDNRERAHRCPLCVDSAYVTVMSDSTVERAQRGEYDAYAAWFRQGRRGRPPARPKWYVWALWCGCPIGERQRSITQNGYARLPVYDPDRHVRLIEDEAAMIDEAKRLKPANYVEAFADWNAED